MSYASFLAGKKLAFEPSGIAAIPPLNPALFPHQRDVTEFLLRCGKGAAFLDTGLGKTLIQLEWARVVCEHTSGNVLILAPLAVAAQTIKEGKRFGIDVYYAKDASEVGPGITITNYERLAKFDATKFKGVVLDESSILKSFMGKTKQMLCASFAATPFRLCCTATPAPNDYMELGNHSDFLGIMPSNEMLARWFINDTMNFGNYRLKGHAVESYWNWVCSWARCISKPSDIGFDDALYDLEPYEFIPHRIAVDQSVGAGDFLFRMAENSATQIHAEKRLTVMERADKIANLVNAEASEAWVVWCNTDYEADALLERMPGAVDVRGSMKAEDKEAGLVAFSSGEARVIVTKPGIAGFGLNWQHSARCAFVGLSYSYEQFYQAVRRVWRFGQKRKVQVHVALAETEQAVFDTVMRKSEEHETMKRAMFAATRRAQHKTHRIKDAYIPKHKAKMAKFLFSLP